MNCRRISDQLSAYLDDELSSRDAERVREHLETCPECRRLLDEIRRTVDALKALPSIEAPGDLQPRIMAGVAETPAEPRPVRVARWRALWPVAAAIAIAAVIMLLNGPRKAPRPIADQEGAAAKQDRTVAMAPKDEVRTQEKSAYERPAAFAAEKAPEDRAAAMAQPPAPAQMKMKKEASAPAVATAEGAASDREKNDAVGGAPAKIAQAEGLTAMRAAKAHRMAPRPGAPADKVQPELIVVSEDPAKARAMLISHARQRGWIVVSSTEKDAAQATRLDLLLNDPQRTALKETVAAVNASARRRRAETAPAVAAAVADTVDEKMESKAVVAKPPLTGAATAGESTKGATASSRGGMGVRALSVGKPHAKRHTALKRVTVRFMSMAQIRAKAAKMADVDAAKTLKDPPAQK